MKRRRWKQFLWWLCYLRSHIMDRGKYYVGDHCFDCQRTWSRDEIPALEIERRVRHGISTHHATRDSGEL